MEASTDLFVRGFMVAILSGVVIWHMAKKFGDGHPEVKEEAKKLAAEKAKRLIGKLLK